MKVRVMTLDRSHQLGGKRQGTVQQAHKKCVGAFVVPRDVHCHHRNASVDFRLGVEDLFV
jgi:hypothetical protein